MTEESAVEKARDRYDRAIADPDRMLTAEEARERVRELSSS